jgi:DNA uptake protein ComE-like DNA-binding protein
LEQYVFVPINLNSASDETLLTIPGITPQALRALKDHRPYKNVQEFRTEIAKYVNAKELGRLERYIAIN